MGMAGLVEALQTAAKAVTDAIPSDDELADTVGYVRQVERSLQEARLRWERVAQELEPIPDADRVAEPKGRAVPVAQGSRFELVPQYKTVRSYNTPAILVAVQGVTEWNGLQTLKSLLAADAVRLTWRYTELMAALSELRVPLHVGFDEVNDESGTDAPMIGTVRTKSGMKRVPILPEDLRKPAETEPIREPEDGEQ